MDRHLRRHVVQEVTGLSRSTIYAKLDPTSQYYDADFPRPVRLGKRAVGWPESSIQEWLAQRETA